MAKKPEPKTEVKAKPVDTKKLEAERLKLENEKKLQGLNARMTMVNEQIRQIEVIKKSIQKEIDQIKG